MEVRVKKWGNSLALRIPKALAVEIGLADNSPVALASIEGKLVVTPVKEPSLRLEDLLAQVTEDNLHGEVDAGTATGSEAW